MDKAILEKYTDTYGCRYTRAQKKKFLKALHEDLESLGYDSTKILGKKFISRAENYLFGNVKQIKTLIVIPYDTPEKKFWNKVIYYPLDGNRTASKTMMATYLPILVMFAIVFCGVYVIQPRMTTFVATTMMSIVMFALTIMLVYMMLHGVHNKKNYNRNSIAIAEAIELAKHMNKDERKKTGFLFTDKNKMNFLGAQSSMNYLLDKGKNPNMICLDCIGNGSKLQIGYIPQNRKLAVDVAKCYPEKAMTIDTIKLNDDMRMQNAMASFKKAVLISCGEMDNEGNLYVMGTGTGKDCVIQEAIADNIGEMLYQFIHTQK